MLEVYSGAGEIIQVPYDRSDVIRQLTGVLTIKQGPEPFSAIGWTKCGHCTFNGRCWPVAEAKHSVALVLGVDQGLALELHNQGVDTIDELLKAFDEERLSQLRRPYGSRVQRVGSSATKILRMARVMASGELLLISRPDVPDAANYVMFDLEGLPPQLDELEKIYLWGIQVFGERPSGYLGAIAQSGREGDQTGWQHFLNDAESIFAEYGDIPFVHWHHYEKTHVSMYISRFGDNNGVASRVLRNLVDLLPIAQESVALPLPSYSLKIVEQYVGFERQLHEYGGDWAMAKYIEATETDDEPTRTALIDEILAYNREDLEATWRVMTWLKGLGTAAAPRT